MRASAVLLPMLAAATMLPLAAGQDSSFAPVCVAVPDEPTVAADPGQTVFLQVECADLDGDLDHLEWGLDGSVNSWLAPSSGDGSDLVFQFGAVLPSGTREVGAVGVDAAGHRSEPVRWTVTAASATVPPEVSGVLGLTALGGGTYGLVRHRRSKRARAAANVQAGVNTGGMAASTHGPALGTSSGPVAQSNSGTTIQGNSGTIILQAPPAPAPTAAASSPSVPPGVPPRRHALYHALEEARDVLDDPEAGAHVVNARDMVGDLLGDLREGKTPLAGQRLATAEAIGRALGSRMPRIQEGAPALQRAAEELRR